MGELQYSIPEEMTRGTFVGNVAKDLGLDNQRLKTRRARIYTEGETEYIELNVNKGILVIKDRIDREQLCETITPCALNFQIVLENPMQFHRISVEIVDINDNDPTFPENSMHLEISESAPPGAVFSLPSAVDSDVGVNTLQSYSLTSNNHFKLRTKEHNAGRNSVDLVLEKPLDREIQEKHILMLTAVDGGEPQRSSTIEIEIIVLDANDNAPIFSKEVYKIAVRENCLIGSVLIKVNATDADKGINGQIKYFFTHISNNAKDLYKLNEETGEIKVTAQIDYEKHKMYEMTVQAKDIGGLVGSCKVIIEVTDVNDNVPFINLMSISNQISEDSLPGTVIAIINVQDKDSGRNGQVICFIDNNIPFKLKSSLNNFYSLETDGILDREKTPQYNITIVATDQGEPSLSATYTILLAVSDVNDNPPRFEQQHYTTYIMENNSPGSSFFSVCAKDDDSGVNSKITYFVQETRINQSVSSFVSVNLDEGVIYAVRSYDFEQLSHFQILVTAKDGGSPSLSASVIVDVYIQDQNDNPPEVLYPVHSKSHPITELIPRSADVGYLVTKVVAVDKDSSNNAWLSYKIIKSTDQTLFKVGIHDGELRTLRQITEKDFSKYKLTILVEDNGQPPYTASINVNVAVIDNFALAFSEFNDLAQRNNDDGDMQFYLILSLVIVSFVFLIFIIVIISIKIHKWRRCKLFNEGSNGALPVIPYYPPRYAEVGATGTLCHVYNYEVCLKTDSGDSELTNRKPIVQNVVDVNANGTETNTHKGNRDSTVEEDIIQATLINGEVRYSIPEEMVSGTFVGDIGKDLSLGIQRLKIGKARFYTEGGAEYIELDINKGQNRQGTDVWKTNPLHFKLSDYS
ncbi:protocadherin beta-5-like [Polypterus senegalus]|uniref:protocadherin beta-5-like n=1 Tax=Polypterus senegalus TaxID=55291 RepID=UPI001965B370|nr:protocadherin beta-5-like [Polypterus senegalus]